MIKKTMRAGLVFSLGIATLAVFTGCLTNNDNNTSSTPTISGQPQPVTVSVGATATFVVTAGGAGTLTYQWMNGTNTVTDGNGISGSTTDSLIISNVQASDGGASFTCVITNSNGSITTDAVLLAVNVPVTTKQLTAGAQANTDYGSFLDIDNMTDYLASEVESLGNSGDIDLFFGYGSTGPAIYSPDVAAGANGFTIAKSTFTTTNATQIRSVLVDFSSITNKAQIDSLWATVSDVSNGKLNIANGDTFMAESNLGLIVLIQVSNLISTTDGTVTLTGASKF